MAEPRWPRAPCHRAEIGASTQVTTPPPCHARALGVQSDTAAATEAMRHGASPVAGALAVGLLAVVAGAVAILADARASGISYWGTSGVYLLGFPAMQQPSPSVLTTQQADA